LKTNAYVALLFTVSSAYLHFRRSPDLLVVFMAKPLYGIAIDKSKILKCSLCCESTVAECHMPNFGSAFIKFCYC
jgi:hypothetical protein